jgi:hypothetical protein
MLLGNLYASIGDTGNYLVKSEIEKFKFIWTFQQLRASHTLKVQKNWMSDVSFH